jgi:molecular chaperone DnaK
MVREAETHAAEDKARRDRVEAANQADSLAYQVERQLETVGGNAPAHDRTRCEELIQEIRQAIKEEAPTERLRSLASDLQQAAHGLSTAAYQQATGPSQPGAGPSGGQTGGERDEDVIDAEYEENR